MTRPDWHGAVMAADRPEPIQPDAIMRAPTLDRDNLHALRCRFGCDDPVVGVFSAPGGCACYPDRIQALCAQHLYKAEPIDGLFTLVDFRLRPIPTGDPVGIDPDDEHE